MEFIKKLRALLCLLFFPLVCYCSQSVTYKEGQHIPLIIIMEQDEEETPSMGIVGPETRGLELAIQSYNAFILVSQPILYSYIYRKQNWNDQRHQENEILKDSLLSDETWDLYVPRDTHYFTENYQLYLLVPKTLNNLFTAEMFNINALQKLNLLPPPESNDYTPLIEQLQSDAGPKSKKAPKEIAHDLKKIFATLPLQSKSKKQSLSLHRKETWHAPIWDIYLSGHGGPKPDIFIANLKPLEMQELLAFFNNFIRVGVLIIASCYAGGENLKNIKFKEDLHNDKILFPLNFVVIVNSVGDISTFVIHDNKSFFKDIFTIAGNLGNSSDAFQRLLDVLGKSNKRPLDIHAQANIPQIILPGGIEIQSLATDDAIMVLGKVKAHVAELENKPIAVFPKKLRDDPKFDHALNLLVYPQVIKAPLVLRASHLSPSTHFTMPSSHLSKKADFKEAIQKQWKNLPTFSDIIGAHAQFFDKEGITIFGKKIDINGLSKNYYLYPNIISMIHGNASHYCNKIVFEGDAFKGSGGILMGLRDAFCNLTERPTIKVFYFDSLEGPNDISLILKAARALAKPDQELSEKELPNKQKQRYIQEELPGDGEHIVLRNVALKTQDDIGMDILIRFQFNNTAWEFKYDAHHWERADLFKPQWWAFKEITDVKQYEEAFKNEVRALMRSNKSLRVIKRKKQKPLSSILEKTERARHLESIIE